MKVDEKFKYNFLYNREQMVLDKLEPLLLDSYNIYNTKRKKGVYKSSIASNTSGCQLLRKVYRLKTICRKRV